jgi:tetratricopeptide (TPR) repeat protein
MKIIAAAASAAALFLALSCASAPAKPSSTPAPAQAQAPAAPSSALAAAPAAPAPAAPLPATASQAEELALFMKPFSAASKECRTALETAELFSLQGKWKSAYQAMESFDQPNADPFALAMKTSIMLRGAVRTAMHRAFALVDLEEGEDLQTLRDSEGDYEPIAFDPVALAEAQASAGVAAPGILSKEIGDYYYDVVGRFTGQWALSDGEILAKAAENYAKADSAGVFDGGSLVNEAESLVRINRGDESDALYAKAIALDPADPSPIYSYATTLVMRGKKAEALAQADKAILAYGEDSGKLNAIALGARTASEMGDHARAESYFAIAEKDYPDNPTPGILRHLVAVQTGDKAAASAAADGLLSGYGSNPNVVRTLISTWYTAGEAAEAQAFLQRGLAKGGDDMTVATLDFYLAVLLAQGSPDDAGRALALKSLDEAEAKFKITIGPENDVYGIIAQIRESLQPAAPETAEPESAPPQGAAPGGAAPATK